MAILLEQTHSVTNVAATPANIIMGSTKAGSLLIVATAWGLGSPANPVTGVSDGGDTFTKLFDTPAGNVTVTFWYAFNVVARATPTVAVAFNDASSNLSAICREYSGISTSSPLDKSISTTGAGTSASSGNSAIISRGNELIVGVFGDDFGAGQSYTAGSGFGNATTISNINSNNVALEDQITSTAKAYAATATLSSANWFAGIATFKAQNPNFRLRPALRPYPFSPGSSAYGR